MRNQVQLRFADERRKAPQVQMIPEQEERLTIRMRALNRKHRQQRPKDQECNSHPSNRNGESIPCVKGPRLEFLLPPDHPRKDRDPPSQIIPRHGQREQRLRSCWRDE